jgi:hypothetical protein
MKTALSPQLSAYRMGTAHHIFSLVCKPRRGARVEIFIRHDIPRIWTAR